MLSAWSDIPVSQCIVCEAVYMINTCLAFILIDYYTRTLLVHCIANGILEIPCHKFHCWFYILFFIYSLPFFCVVSYLNIRVQSYYINLI